MLAAELQLHTIVSCLTQLLTKPTAHSCVSLLAVIEILWCLTVFVLHTDKKIVSAYEKKNLIILPVSLHQQKKKPRSLYIAAWVRNGHRHGSGYEVLCGFYCRPASKSLQASYQLEAAHQNVRAEVTGTNAVVKYWLTVCVLFPPHSV